MRLGKQHRFLKNEHGQLFTEYLVLLGVVGLVVASAFFALGIPLLRFHRLAEFFASAPIP